MDISKEFSEQDVRTKHISPAIAHAGWDLSSPLVREEFPITAGRIIAKAQVCKRYTPKRADYVLFLRPNCPLAVIEAKDGEHTVGDGIQQALDYARMLDVPFAFSTNGKGFLFHNDLAGDGEPVERELAMDDFPSPETLFELYDRRRGLSDNQRHAADIPYYTDNPNKTPRYYQCVAVNRVVEAIAGGEKRALLVMATGAGKTYTAFQIIWHLWKAGHGVPAILGPTSFWYDCNSPTELQWQHFVQDDSPPPAAGGAEGDCRAGGGAAETSRGDEGVR